jgi:hypothetical protein
MRSVDKSGGFTTAQIRRRCFGGGAPHSDPIFLFYFVSSPDAHHTKAITSTATSRATKTRLNEKAGDAMPPPRLRE